MKVGIIFERFLVSFLFSKTYLSIWFLQPCRWLVATNWSTSIQAVTFGTLAVSLPSKCSQQSHGVPVQDFCIACVGAPEIGWPWLQRGWQEGPEPTLSVLPTALAHLEALKSVGNCALVFVCDRHLVLYFYPAIFQVLWLSETGLGLDASLPPHVLNYTVISPGPFNHLLWKVMNVAEGRY